MSRVGVVGAGVMGAGVAQDLAQWGHEVVVVDISDEILERCRSEIYRQLRMSKMLGTTGNGDDNAVVLDRISFTTSITDLKTTEYVIENSTENWDVKAAIYPEMDKICSAEVIFAANTSCVSITRLGSLTSRPDKVVGIHFMNPVPMKKTVEMIRGMHTSEETISTTRELLGTLGKSSVLVNDMPGFVSNRILMLTVNEAAFTVQDQVAEAAEVDRVFRDCFGHPMGPLETADLIGLDTILYSVEVLHESFGDSKYRPCPLLKKMVHGGLLGRKSGQGFYSYT